MKTFCPNCEKETDCTFVCEVYSCNECGEDYGSYEKPQATALAAFLRKIMLLGLLRGSPRLRDEALRILDGVEASDVEGSVTENDEVCPVCDGAGEVAGDYFADDGMETCPRCAGSGARY